MTNIQKYLAGPNETMISLRTVFIPSQKSIEIPKMNISSINIPAKSMKSFDYALFNMKAEFAERLGKAMELAGASTTVYEQTLKDLSASSGISGTALEKLSDNARQVGVSSGLGATQALKAYQILASQVDVSKVGLEELNTLQEKTMTLAKASGMEVEGAAVALSGTLNQFGLQAEEANRVMNVLAAGARYGAAGIPELSQALGVAGSAARAAGVDVESATGALEVLSRANLQGADAGAALGDIMTKMQTSLGMDFSNTSFSAALEALKPQLNDTAYLTQVFGEGNLSAAQYLIANAAAVQEMTDQVTGSNVAQEQAAIRSDTVAERMARLRQRVEDMKIGLFNLTGGAIGYVGIAGEMLSKMANLVPLVGLLSKGFKVLRTQKLLAKAATDSLTLSINRQVIAQKLHSLWSGIVKVATIAWTGVQWLLNVALNANPIGLIILGITALIGVITLVVNKFSTWGSALSLLMGPLGLIINTVMILKNNWESIVEAFKTDGILGGLKRIGAVILDMLLYPLQQILELVGKIPGLSFAKKGAEKIQGVRDRLNLATPGKQEDARAAAPQAEEGGISAVTLPGTENASLVPTYQTTSPEAARSSSQTTVSGGTRSTNVTLNLGKLMDSVNIHAQEFRDGLNDLDNKVLESLTRVLNVAQSSVI